jgi:hypothetical protein
VTHRRTNDDLASLVRVVLLNTQLKMIVLRLAGCVPYTIMNIIYKSLSSKKTSKSSRSGRLVSVLSHIEIEVFILSLLFSNSNRDYGSVKNIPYQNIFLKDSRC